MKTRRARTIERPPVANDQEAMASQEPATSSKERLDPTPDEVLARRVKHGDADALEQLVRRYLRPIRAIVASYFSEGSDADDAAQETFLRMVRGMNGYDPERPFAPWLYQIARNVARDQVASRARWPVEDLSGGLPSPLSGPDVLLERADMRARVNAAMAQLPERRRTAFYLCDVEGYSTSEVARIMGLSPGTVRSHVHHARTAVRAALAQSPEQV